GTTQLSVHVRAARITLSSPVYNGPVSVTGGVSSIPTGQYPSATQCVSQNHMVQYSAAPVDANGNPMANCSATPNPTAGCVNNNDYSWSTDNSTVAQVSNYGFVIARNPGMTNVYATLNGTISAPLAFVSC